MTIIEIIDKPILENIISILQLNPDRVIFLTINDESLDDWIHIFSDFVEKKIEFKNKSLKKSSIEDTANEIKEFLQQENINDDLYFDILGGRERILLSIGYLAALNPNHRFHIIRPDFATGKILDVETCREVDSKEPDEYSLKDMIRLFGGTLIDFEKPCGDNRFPNTSVDGSALSNLFQINSARSYIKKLFYSLANGSINTGNGNCSCLEIWSDFTENAKTPKFYSDSTLLFNKFKADGVIRSYHFNGQKFKITFVDNNQIYEEVFKIASEKYGNILELYIGVLIREILNEIGDNNSMVYQSVKIDWDDDVYVTNNGRTNYGATNEIDIMTVINYRPIYISCKLGNWDQNELYKLNSIAEHFGGKYSRKLLISYKPVSSLNQDQERCRTLKERAEDMGISMIDDLRSSEMTENQLFERIKDAIM